jgi:hypothetical protein
VVRQTGVSPKVPNRGIQKFPGTPKTRTGLPKFLKRSGKNGWKPNSPSRQGFLEWAKTFLAYVTPGTLTPIQGLFNL